MTVPWAASGPARRANLKDEVAAYVRDLILSGRVHAGQRLDQDDIAARLGVSRLPVREALITLEAEGMIENIARRGSFVAPLSREDIADHFEMFGLLAGMAAAAAVRSGRVVTLVEELENLQAAMRAVTDPQDLDRLNELFHRAVNRGGSSRRLRSVLRILANNMPTRFFDQDVDGEWLRCTLDEHDGIVSALRVADGPLAARLTGEHFAHTGEQAVRILEHRGFWRSESAS